MMKPKHSPPRAARRPAAATRHHDDEIVILIPDLHVLRVIARSVLLAAALLSLPVLRATIALSCAAGPAPAGPEEPGPKWVDNPFALRMLVADLRREGLLNPELRNLFVGDPGSRAPFLKRNRVDLMSPEFKKLLVDDNSVDFVLAADGLRDPLLGFVARVLKVGGIVALRLSPSNPFCLPANYRIVYIRRFGSTIVAIKKMSHGNAGELEAAGLRGRRLLTVANKNGKFDGIMIAKDKMLVMLKMMMKGAASFLDEIGVLGAFATSVDPPARAVK